MAFNYANAQATAERLIAQFGQTATLTKYASSGTVYAPTRSSTGYGVIVVIMDYRNSEIDGTLVRQGDKKIYLSTDGLTVTPAASDEITLESVVHSVIDVKPLSPGGTVVYYEIQARR
jgi:hypothetical protein